MSMPLPQILLVGFLVAFTLTAAVIDVRTRRLPNWLTVPAFAAALLFHLVTGGVPGLLGSLAGFAVGFSILFVLWLVGGGGGGDVKLMGAVGAWLGWKTTLAVFVLSTLFAVFGSILLLSIAAIQLGFSRARRRYGRPVKELDEAAREEQRRKRRLMPYALPVACSVWLVLAYQIIVKH